MQLKDQGKDLRTFWKRVAQCQELTMVSKLRGIVIILELIDTEQVDQGLQAGS